MNLARPALLSLLALVGAAGCALGDDGASAAPTTPTPGAPVVTAPSPSPSTTTTTRAVAVPPKPRRLDAFQTPSGNITCATADGDVACEISQFTYTPPPKPDWCDVDWGYRYFIRPDGSGEFSCAGDTMYNPELPKPAAGTTVTIGHAICEVQTESVKCRASETDGGLFLSPAKYYTSFEE